MRDLQQTPNIGLPSANYPNGSIIDEVSGITGTALTEKLYGDLMVNLHKLMDQAGISQNNLPDNETNGYQLIEGFFKSMLPEWVPSSSKIDISNVKWVTYGQELYYHKTTTNTNNAPNLDSANWYRVLYWDGTKIIFSGLRTTNLSNISIFGFGSGGPDINNIDYCKYSRVGGVANLQAKFTWTANTLDGQEFSFGFADPDIEVGDLFQGTSTGLESFIAEITSATALRVKINKQYSPGTTHTTIFNFNFAL